jgi:hypothetical protein
LLDVAHRYIIAHVATRRSVAALAAAVHVLGRGEWKSPRDGGYALAWQLERHFRVVTWSGLRRYVLTMAVLARIGPAAREPRVCRSSEETGIDVSS